MKPAERCPGCKEEVISALSTVRAVAERQREKGLLTLEEYDLVLKGVEAIGGLLLLLTGAIEEIEDA